MKYYVELSDQYEPALSLGRVHAIDENGRIICNLGLLRSIDECEDPTGYVACDLW